MPDLKFEDPPETHPTGRRGKWREIGDALRARPGEWAVVAEDVARTTPGQINSGKYNLGPGKFEATGRTIDGKFVIYARYVGGDSDA